MRLRSEGLGPQLLCQLVEIVVKVVAQQQVEEHFLPHVQAHRLTVVRAGWSGEKQHMTRGSQQMDLCKDIAVWCSTSETITRH